MLFLMKFSMPVEAVNAAARNAFEVIPQILQEQKPEAAYFGAEDGKRTAFLFIEMNDVSQLPAIAEPWFLALNATCEITPVMRPEDLQKAGPAIGQAVRKYAR